MGAVVAICAKDLRQRVRDRSAVALAFVAPVLVATVMSFAFSGVDDLRFAIGVVAPAGDEVAEGLVEALTSPDAAEFLDVERFDDPAEARAAVDDGDVEAAIVVPEGFATAVAAGERPALGVLGRVDDTLAARVAEGIASGLAARVDAARLAVAAALAAGADPGGLADLVAAATELDPVLEVVEEPAGDRPLRSIDYYAPAMAVFFAFFAAGFTAQSFFAERRDQTLDRIVAAPVRPAAAVLGKVLAAFVLAASSQLAVWAVTALVFGADWGEPLPAALLILAMAAAITAVTALVVTVARTERQAEGLASMLVFGLALLGGNFVSLSMAPPLLRTLALATPNGWALRGFTDLATGADDLAAVVGPALAVLAFAAVAGGVAAALAPRAVAS